MGICTTPGCGQRAAARICLPLLAGSTGHLAFTIIRPATTANPVGDLVCLDCTHSAVDEMLMQAMAPGQGPAVEQRPDGAA